MDAYLVWIETNGRVSPQKLWSEPGAAPFLDEGIRGRVVGSPIKLPVDRTALSLDDLAKLYDAPAVPAL